MTHAGIDPFERAFNGVLIPAGHRHAQPLGKELATGFQPYSAVCTCNSAMREPYTLLVRLEVWTLLLT